MKPARWPRSDPAAGRLLSINVGTGRVDDRLARDLPDLLRPGDLLILNDAATLPASLIGHTDTGAGVELRLLALDPDGRWRGVLFGAGDWHTPTEDRPLSPPLE